MMFVGYPLNREEDSYRTQNKDTTRAVISKDTIFLNGMLFFTSPIKLETVELGDVSDKNLKAENAVEEEVAGGTDEMGELDDKGSGNENNAKNSCVYNSRYNIWSVLLMSGTKLGWCRNRYKNTKV